MRTFINGINNGYNFKAALLKPYMKFFANFGIFLIGVIILCIDVLRKKKAIREDQILLFFIPITSIIFILSLLSALKVGSAINYFNEALLCMIILAIYILEKYYLKFKKIYMSLLMVFGIIIALTHAFKYPSRLLRSPTNNTEIKEYLDKYLKSNYFYTDSKEIAMSYPNRCILFPQDIHFLTFRREVFNYSLIENWAANNLKYLVIMPRNKNIYGIDVNKNYVLKKKFANYDLYELASYTLIK